MKTIIVTKPFKFAHEGIHVEEFTASENPIETTDECAEVAIREKWAKLYKEPKDQKPKKPGDEVKPGADDAQPTDANTQGNVQSTAGDQSDREQSDEAGANTPE